VSIVFCIIVAIASILVNYVFGYLIVSLINCHIICMTLRHKVLVTRLFKSLTVQYKT